MDHGDDPAVRLAAKGIPARGLREALAGWSTAGQVYRALGGDPAEREWSAQAVQRRANRIFFDDVQPTLRSWPRRTGDWLEALPAVSTLQREVSGLPRHVSWRDTARLGWPPTAFVRRPRRRTSDETLSQTLAWTVARVEALRGDARSLGVKADADNERRLDAAYGVSIVEPVASVEPVAPSRLDLANLRSEGAPWNALAGTAKVLLELERLQPFDVALRLIEAPEAWRLFHLGVFGELLVELRARGWTAKSLAPLSGRPSPRAAYQCVEPITGDAWDLWFEAAGAWKQYGVQDPYLALSHAISGETAPLGTDIALIRHGERALLVECKHSDNHYVVARDGYRAASAYLAEARERIAPQVLAVSCGPSSVVKGLAWTENYAGRVGVCRPSDVGALVDELLAT